MKNFMKDNGGLLLAAAVLLAALLAVFSAFGGGLADPLSNLAGIVTAPARTVAARFFNWTESVYNYSFRYEELERENERLKQENARLEQAAIAGEAASKQNEILREALGLLEKETHLELDLATVVSRSSSNWESTITINKGSVHDIAVGDCAIDQFGALVGIVEEVGTTWSTIRTVIDPDIEIGALIVRTDSAVIAEGDFSLMHQSQLKLSFLPESTQLIAGDLVLTSGLSGNYPADLIIGSIRELHTEVSGISRYAILEPRADLKGIKQVFVIKDFRIVE